MTDYDDQVAYHYSAYRPPLHQRILQEVLAGQRFRRGLDLGCGTGRSTLALKNFCDEVCGVEPSREMLAHTQAQPGITFHSGSAEQTPFETNSFDVMTMAGCLFYTDQKKTAIELARIGRPGSLVVVYDFEIEMRHLMKSLCPDWEPVTGSYDHAARFNEPDLLKPGLACQREESMDFSLQELVHLLLSEKARFVALDCSEEALREQLVQAYRSLLPVRLFWSTYRVPHNAPG